MLKCFFFWLLRVADHLFLVVSSKYGNQIFTLFDATLPIYIYNAWGIHLFGKYVLVVGGNQREPTLTQNTGSPCPDQGSTLDLLAVRLTTEPHATHSLLMCASYTSKFQTLLAHNQQKNGCYLEMP